MQGIVFQDVAIPRRACAQKGFNKMNTRRIRLILLTISLALTLVVAPAVADDVKPADKEAKVAPAEETSTNVAMVNGTAITKSAFDRELSLFERRIRRPISALQPDQLAQVNDSILNDLINRELLFQESGKQKIDIPKETIQKEFDRIKGRYEDPKKFEAIMAQMQMTTDSLKDQIHRKMAVQELIKKEVGAKVSVTEAEAKRVFDENPEDFKQKPQVRARHILIKVEKDADEAAKAAARKKLEAVQEKANKGEDFSALAKTHSEGPSNVRGGDLGFFGRGQMVKPFEEAAFALEPGKISDVVETQFGYHLIKVEEKKAERSLPFEEVRAKLMEKLKSGKIEKQMMTYLLALREKAKIETFLPKAAPPKDAAAPEAPKDAKAKE
jgi:peptidyl-prolyl cis-trans isomerase C